METYDKIKKTLAVAFMHDLNNNRPEGKMCLSNGECADIEKAFDEQDWPKLARYLDKYTESEDERIRKWIVTFIEVRLPDAAEFEPQYRAAIAYLEKQKELLTPEEKMNHPLYLEGFDVGRKVGQVEAEQKPAWSEEDEDVVRHICRYLGYHCNEATARGCTEWLNVRLKSLRPTKQEWSEEDESILEALIYDIERLPMQGVLTHRSCDSYIKFLKALRPGWKPTQAQMEALLVAIHCTPSDENMLISLYNDLKKL